jgi:hypothetical protein
MLVSWVSLWKFAPCVTWERFVVCAMRCFPRGPRDTGHALLIGTPFSIDMARCCAMI